MIPRRATSLSPRCLVTTASLCLSGSIVPSVAFGQNIQQNTQTFDLGQPVAPTLRWTMRGSGLCGNSCRNGPRAMYSAAFEDTFYMSWMSVKNQPGILLDGEDVYDWEQFGNVSSFEVSESGEFTYLDTVGFDGVCKAVYGITGKRDGSLVSVLCEGYGDSGSTVGTDPLPGSIDLLSSRRDPNCDSDNEAFCYPLGSFCSTASPLYIFEFEADAGQRARITETPTRMIRVNHAVGGWRYGHHEFSLNQAEDTYFLAIKVRSSNCQHEGLTHFGVTRGPEPEYVGLTDGWACSGGHQESNRIAYNAHGDFWSILCRNDLGEEPKRFVSHGIKGIDVSTIPGTSYLEMAGGPEYHEGEELLAVETTSPWNHPASAAGILSLGADGWLALAPAPDPEAPYEQRTLAAGRLGLIHLPLDAADLASQRQYETVPIYGEKNDPTPTGEAEVYFHEWQWLNVPNAADGSAPRIGFANLAHFSREGEDGERLLLGWSPSSKTQGITSEYVVAEADRSGNIRGEPITLEGAGWGEENRWTTMPNSGCVVFPFTWVGDAPGESYPLTKSETDISVFPTSMRMTSLCPDGDQPETNDPITGSTSNGDTTGGELPEGVLGDGSSEGSGQAPGTGLGDGSSDGELDSSATDQSGCGCSVPASPRASKWFLLVAGMAFAAARRRRGPRTTH